MPLPYLCARPVLRIGHEVLAWLLLMSALGVEPTTSKSTKRAPGVLGRQCGVLVRLRVQLSHGLCAPRKYRPLCLTLIRPAYSTPPSVSSIGVCGAGE